MSDYDQNLARKLRLGGMTNDGAVTLAQKLQLMAQGGVTKTDLGLGNVDNTSDANKPVSTPQQTALDLKANLASPTFTGTVSGVTKSMVGLGNVDNTTDVNKPVSTAQQTALDLKANLASPTFTGTVSGVTKSMVGLGSVENVGAGDPFLPTGAIRSTVRRSEVQSNTHAGVTTGRLSLYGIRLIAGDVVNSISFVAGATAGATLTHTWFSLYSNAASPALLATSADDTSASWTASTSKTLSMSTPYTVPTTAIYYLGIVVIGTTPPSLIGTNASPSAANAIAPVMVGTSTTGIASYVPPSPAAAISANIPGFAYAWVS